MKKPKFSFQDWLRNDNLDKRQKEVSQLLERKCLVEKLSFVDNQNMNVKMLNQSRLHLNEYGTWRLVNNFYYKWWDTNCLDRNTIEKSVKTKKLNENLKVSTANIPSRSPNILKLSWNWVKQVNILKMS